MKVKGPRFEFARRLLGICRSFSSGPGRLRSGRGYKTSKRASRSLSRAPDLVLGRARLGAFELLVIIDGSLSEQMIEDLIEDPYDLVVSQLPASRRCALGWTTDAP